MYWTIQILKVLALHHFAHTVGQLLLQVLLGSLICSKCQNIALPLLLHINVNSVNTPLIRDNCNSALELIKTQYNTCLLMYKWRSNIHLQTRMPCSIKCQAQSQHIC